MDSEKLNHILALVASNRGERLKEVAHYLSIQKRGRELVLDRCREKGARARARHRDRATNPFSPLLRPQGVGAVPLEVWTERYLAWQEGWDAGPAGDPPGA